MAIVYPTTGLAALQEKFQREGYSMCTAETLQRHEADTCVPRKPRHTAGGVNTEEERYWVSSY